MASDERFVWACGVDLQPRWLETGDEWFDYWDYPARGRWEIYGLELPDAVLEKIYHLNAEWVFGQFKSAGRGGAQ